MVFVMGKKVLSSVILSLLVFLSVFCSQNKAHARSLEEIKNSGTLRIGICDDLPPVQFRDSKGDAVGIDPDLGKMIAESLKVKPEWKHISSPKYRAEMLLGKNADLVISSFQITKERMDVIGLSEPYFTTGLALMIRSKDRGTIKTYNDLDGKTIVTTKGSTSEKMILELLPGARLIPVSDTLSTYDYLKRGEADAIVNDRIFLDHYASGKKDFYVLDGTLSADQYGIGVNKEDSELLDYVNSFITEIQKNGRLNSLISKYINGAQLAQVPMAKTFGFSIYEVQENDTLIGLAKKFYNDATKWNVIHASNLDTIKLVNILTQGWKIKIPNLKSSPPEPPATASTPEKVADQPEKKISALESVLKAKANSSPIKMPSQKKTVANPKIKEFDLNEVETYDKRFN